MASDDFSSFKVARLDDIDPPAQPPSSDRAQTALTKVSPVAEPGKPSSSPAPKGPAIAPAPRPARAIEPSPEHRLMALERLLRALMTVLVDDPGLVLEIKATPDDKKLIKAAAAVVKRMPHARREDGLTGLLGLHEILSEIEALHGALTRSFTILKERLDNAKRRYSWMREWTGETDRIAAVVLLAEKNVQKLGRDVEERLYDMKGFLEDPRGHLNRITAAHSSLADAAERVVHAAASWRGFDIDLNVPAAVYEKVGNTALLLGGRFAVRKGWKLSPETSAASGGGSGG